MQFGRPAHSWFTRSREARSNGNDFFLFFEEEWSCFWLALIGCGSSDGLNRQAISGTVTLDGQPISSGAILFEPATQESGTAVGATIRQGRFAISSHEGPVPGSYRVRIYSSSGIQAPPAKGQTDRTPSPDGRTVPRSLQYPNRASRQRPRRSANRYRFRPEFQRLDRSPLTGPRYSWLSLRLVSRSFRRAAYMKSRPRGFTLIELLVVIGIIVVLIGHPAAGRAVGSRGRATLAVCQ